MSNLIKEVDHRKAIFSTILNPEGGYDHLFLDELNKIYYQRQELKHYDLREEFTNVSEVNYQFKYDEAYPENIIIVGELSQISGDNIKVEHKIDAVKFVDAIYEINLEDRDIEDEQFFLTEIEKVLALLADKIFDVNNSFPIGISTKAAGLLFDNRDRIIGTFNSVVLSNSESYKTLALNGVSCRFSIDEINLKKAVINTNKNEITFLLNEMMGLSENGSLQNTIFSISGSNVIINEDKEPIVVHQEILDEEDYYDSMIDLVSRLNDMKELEVKSTEVSSKKDILKGIFDDDEDDDF